MHLSSFNGWRSCLQELVFGIYLAYETAENSTALWEALAALRKLRTVAITDYSELSTDNQEGWGRFFQSVSLISHIR